MRWTYTSVVARCAELLSPEMLPTSSSAPDKARATELQEVKDGALKRFWLVTRERRHPAEPCGQISKKGK